MKKTLIFFAVFMISACEKNERLVQEYMEQTTSEYNSPIVFSENFDNQSDWTSGIGGSTTSFDVSNGKYLPNRWFSFYQEPVWSASKGYRDGRENIEILSSNIDKTEYHKGKSAVFWRDSTESPRGMWNSDGQLTKYFPTGFKELHVKFRITFDPNWTALGETGLTKLFRIGHWNGRKPIYKFFNDGNSGPILIWDYDFNEVGSRLALTLRGYPIESNYEMRNPPIVNWPREQGTMNFKNNIRDLNGDGIEENSITTLKSAIDNRVIDSHFVKHEELWGSKWRQIEFYVKMNSSPGALDGVLMMWIDKQLVVKNTTVPWAGSNSIDIPKWNFVTLGGNSHFHAYPNSVRRQEWYAIDDLMIYDGLQSD